MTVIRRPQNGGTTPRECLRTATNNPAKALHYGCAAVHWSAPQSLYIRIRVIRKTRDNSWLEMSNAV